MLATEAAADCTQDTPIIPLQECFDAVDGRRRKSAADGSKNLLHGLDQVIVVDRASLVEIDLCKHQVARDQQCFDGMYPVIADAKLVAIRLRHLAKFDRGGQAIEIVTTIGN